MLEGLPSPHGPLAAVSPDGNDRQCGGPITKCRPKRVVLSVCLVGGHGHLGAEEALLRSLKTPRVWCRSVIIVVSVAGRGSLARVPAVSAQIERHTPAA